MSRVHITKANERQIYKTAEIMQKREGVIFSPNGTGEAVEGKGHKGHINGLEERWLREYADKRGFTKEQYREIANNPNLYHIEPPKENLSHKFEEHDHNQGMMNVAAYMAGEYPEESANIFYCYHDDGRGEVLVKNQNTGELSKIADFGYERELQHSNEQTVQKEQQQEEMHLQEEYVEEQYGLSM